MKTYYIAYETVSAKLWKIAEIPYDLSEPKDLELYLLLLAQELNIRERDVVVLYWKELKPKKFWQFWR